MAKSLYQSPGYSVSDLFTLIGRILDKDTTTDNGEWNVRCEQAITVAGQTAASWEGRGWWWSRKIGTFETLTLTQTDEGTSRSSDTVTTTTESHGLGQGQYVVVSGCSDATFDGFHRVANAATATTFTYEQEGDDTDTEGGGTVYVVSYPLRQVNGTLMTDLFVPVRIGVDDDWLAVFIPRTEWMHWFLTTPATVSQPSAYTIFEDDYAAYAESKTYTRELYLGLQPAPDTASRLITVDYIVRHSKITDGDSGSEDAALIVPADFHYGVYVQGAVKLLKKQTLDPSFLIEDGEFRQTMERMALVAPGSRDTNPHDLYPDAVARPWPHFEPVLRTSHGLLSMKLGDI